MKTPVLVVVLALSLTANAVLFLKKTDANFPGVSASAEAGSASHDITGARATFATKGGSVNEPATDEGVRLGRIWASLQHSDPKTLAERLRAAGFPPSMIRALIVAQVQEQFSARRKALMAQQEEKPYWQARASYYMDSKTMAAMRELGREQNDLLKQLLGPDGAPGSEEALAYQRRQFGNLPREKLDQLQSIVTDYNDLRNDVYRSTNGVMLPEDREKLALLEKEQRADLAAVLTPEELENYELRSSTTANNLRSQLALFKPTEDEFRAIFRLQQAFDEKYGANGAGMTSEQFRVRQAQLSELTEQMKNVLTPDRIADYKQAVDPNYQMVNRLVARLELPATAATEVVTVQQDISKRAGALRSDKSLTPESRNAQLSALAQEATAKLTATLGDRGLEAYKQYGGQWVQNLVPRAPAAPPGVR